MAVPYKKQVNKGNGNVVNGGTWRSTNKSRRVSTHLQTNQQR